MLPSQYIISVCLTILGIARDTLIARKVQNITICFATSDSRTIKESPICGCHHTDYIGALQDGKKKVVGDVQMYHSKISYSQCFEGMMLEAIVRLCPGFLNLRNLTLDFANISPSFHSHRLSVFFRCLWTAVEGKLDCLSLVGSLSGYHSILHNPPTLRSLKQLDIQIVNHPHDLNGGLDANALLESISYFINRHSQTLNALKIWSLPSRSQAVDLSPLFSHLSSFPTLTSLDVRLAFNKLFDPSGLQYLIWNTSFTLRRLSLRLNPSGFSMPWDTESLLGCWLSSCLADPYAFSYLKVLDVYPSRQPESVFILLECIKRASGGLQEITIRDQYLQNDEARAIINAASHCRNLVSLHLNVWEMDIHLIDLLSKKLPGLENLSLATVESQFDDFPVSNLSRFIQYPGR
ncbi:hypothetical protein D9613_007499 [Agrocybe pediades]|uniref:Uncharacterized protein n=1 Tax=Agrocybe pediades TaxID=84607 RepID=A0A8H4QM71_9AGAR|nr:hypothetical protein D9613_007499 [Agrocybe pediades]